ncbi:MAG: ATP-binding protein [Bacteroidota bacterium]
MKNVVGIPSRGKDFFPRDKIIDKIYRRLDAGSSIYLAAPRRVGKTSIMRFLEDNPRTDYHFIYITTESIHDIERYYERLIDEILESDAIREITTKRSTAAQFIKQVFSKVQKIKLSFLEIEVTDSSSQNSFQATFEELISKFEKLEETLIVMVDEFPQTVENIRDRSGKEEAEKFLQLNRQQRQQAARNIRFIYTGSIGLPAVVKKLTSTKVINDLNVIEVPPLSELEATALTTQLLNNYRIPFQEETISYLLETIKWLIPFHIQLAVQELIDVYEAKEQALTPKSVDSALDQLMNIRNDIYFEHYYGRLEDAFPKQSYLFAIAFLDELAVKG